MYIYLVSGLLSCVFFFSFFLLWPDVYTCVIHIDILYMYISQASNLASNPNQSGSEVVVDARAQTLATAGTLCTKDTEPRMMSSVAERRLRPLWDAIDSRHYKSALKLASSLLAKHPDSVYLLVIFLFFLFLSHSLCFIVFLSFFP